MIDLGLQNKNILVTGAEGGLGRLMIRTLAEAGANVIAQDIQDPIQCKHILEQLGKDCVTYTCDITDIADVTSMFEDIQGKVDGLDVLINNAGIRRDGLLVRLTEEQWDSVIDVNLKGVFLCTQAAVKLMIKKRNGKVITISSIAGLMGNAGQTNYAATKGGVVSMTKSWAREYGKRGITFNAIAPGLIESPMTETLPEKEKSELVRGIALGYLGKPQDVADGVLFLASKLSDYINGEVLRIDGGLAM